MKKVLLSVLLAAPTFNCFAFDCFSTLEYKNSVAISKLALAENRLELEKGVNFLVESKGIALDQALKEIVNREPTPETLLFDQALKQVSEKIRSTKPQSIDECVYLFNVQREYESIGKQKIQFIVGQVTGQKNKDTAPQCKQQVVQKTEIEICVLQGASLNHDLYTLKADKTLIFSLTDDYVEKVILEHSVPDGMAIEFPLSQQGSKIVQISGGCIPESKDGAEHARLCNFFWGKYQIVKDVRFEFK